MILMVLSTCFWGSWANTRRPSLPVRVVLLGLHHWRRANVANLLLVAAIDVAGLAVAFPISIGIALVEGVVLSYALQPKGDVRYLGIGIALAIAAVLFDARAYRTLTARGANATGIMVSVISGVLMGVFPPFVTRAMTHGHALTSYGVSALAGGCFNFIAAGLVGVPISYAIGQSAPLIAATWGVLV